MRRRYLLLPCPRRWPFHALGKTNHCDCERVSVDWGATTEAGREQELAVTAQLDRALDGLDRQGGERNKMVALVFCPLAGKEPRCALWLVEILKFNFARAGNFGCSRCRGQREP